MVNFRRVAWVALPVSLAVMLAMMYLQQKARQNLPDPGTPPATLPAPSTAPATSEPAPQASQAGRSEPTVAPTTGSATAPAPASQPEPEAPAATFKWTAEPVGKVVLGSTDPDEFMMEVELTSVGAAVRSIKLADYFATVEDKRRYDKDPATYAQAVAQDPALKGHYVLLGPVGSGKDQVLPMATRRIEFDGLGLHLADVVSLPDQATGESVDCGRWSVGQRATDDDGTQSVTFTCDFWRNDATLACLEKTYSLAPKSHSLRVELRLVNLSGGKLSASIVQVGPVGMHREDLRSDMRNVTYARLGEKGRIEVSKAPIKDVEKAPRGLNAGVANPLGRSDSATDPTLWIAETNKFFAAVMYVVPEPAPEQKRLDAPQARATFFDAGQPDAKGGLTFLTGVKLGAYELEADETQSVGLDFFAGAKQRDLFQNNELYNALAYQETLTFQGCSMCTFTWLSLAVMDLLKVFSKVTFGNYGLAIMLLVLVVRILLHPLTKKGQVSMSRMQKLQPEMQKIREKYADNKEKLNQETMKLYKSQGASPIFGCLPMLLQMPIWVALWGGIQASVELRHAAFLPVWIIDLAAPDALVDFGRVIWNVPLIGPVTGFNLLPILLCVAMYLQTKLNPQMSGASTAMPDQQQSSMKMMKYMMPAMMLVFFYNAPSGLTMYIMTSVFAGVGEQWVIRRHIQAKEAAEAAAETTIAMPGKYFRGQKPKKPKGPFQVKH